MAAKSGPIVFKTVFSNVILSCARVSEAFGTIINMFVNINISEKGVYEK